MVNIQQIGDRQKIIKDKVDGEEWEVSLKSIADKSIEDIDIWVTSNPTQTILKVLARVVWALTKVVLRIWKNQT
jgi:hypothetical protein